MNGDGTCSTDDFTVDCSSGGDNPGVCIDLKQAVDVAGQAICDRIRCGVKVERIGGDTNRCSDCDILVDVVRA